tara:strand:+ start:438 stop:713 length:276 start_codon:yes stop_codon:yes gene_type:complete
MLRKIPLGPFIEILTDLFENGADFIDLSCDENNEEESLRDSVKITVKPEYLSPEEDDEDEEVDHGMDFLITNENDTSTSSPLSEDDIEDLI